MLENGTLLKDRYRIAGLLGAGGTGCVYFAIDLSIQKQWAVKEILYKKGVGIRFAEHEVLMMKQLDYRMFPRIVDAWQEDTCYFIVSDYIDGISLADLLQRGKVPEKTALAWSAELAGALRYLHGRESPILYLDLKPENIMVKQDGSLALIDFGIAQRIAEENCEFGTPGYAAPEQYRKAGDTKPGPQADIFAFGMTLYAMLSGLSPDPKLTEQTQKIKKDFTVKRKIKRFLLRCINTNQKRRFQNGGELLSALNQIREIHHKTKTTIIFRNLCILLFISFLPFLYRYDVWQKQNAAAGQMLAEAGLHMEEGDYTKEGVKIICGYLNSGCLSERTEQQFLYEAARNYFELQNNYKEAKRYFERLNEKVYPEKLFFLKLCVLQTEFVQDAAGFKECLDEFYEYNRMEGFSRKKYENELFIAALLEKPDSEEQDIKKIVCYLEAGMKELMEADEEDQAFVQELRAEYARRLCMMNERVEDYEKMRYYGLLAIRFLPKGEETAKKDIAERIAERDKSE